MECLLATETNIYTVGRRYRDEIGAAMTDRSARWEWVRFSFEGRRRAAPFSTHAEHRVVWIRAATASTRAEDLFPARAGGRVHRQGQGAPALRVRRQSLRCHYDQPREGWPVRHPCKGAARQPYDGHTPATVIPDMEAMVGNTIARILADKGYRGHNARPITSSGSSSPARSEG